MTANREVYEGKILETLIKNNERLAVNEKEVQDIKQILTNIDSRLTEVEKLLGWLRIIGAGVVTIALSLVANFIYSVLVT